MPFSVGQRVQHIKLKKSGAVVAALAGGKYKISLGSLSVICEEHELRAATEKPVSVKVTARVDARRDTGKPLMLDLHGTRVHEVRNLVEQAVNSALLQNAESLEIVHGHGSGKVQREVHEVLASLRVVKHYKIKEGNTGTTQVYF